MSDYESAHVGQFSEPGEHLEGVGSKLDRGAGHSQRWYLNDDTFPNPLGGIDRQPAFHKESVRRWYYHRNNPVQVGEPG